ncbi:hypothetical protein BD779DRAFT_1615823 [Infundibulicybe gibba]|nr:hypothetical protein BD779DRAFT_1615823 [Infundibulicybe gibba]
MAPSATKKKSNHCEGPCKSKGSINQGNLIRCFVKTYLLQDELSKDWNAPVYAFFQLRPAVETINGRRSHVFQCAAKSCLNKSRGVRRFLDKGDSKSTGNMLKHARKCWGADTIQAATLAKDADAVRAITIRGVLHAGSITAMFKRKGNTITYSHKQHTRKESKAEIVRWVCESMRPFEIVADRGFQSLMKTGRPEYYIPSPSTVFVKAWVRMAKMLKAC